MSRSNTVIVLGMVGQTPFAGVAWQALHYLFGLQRLGCEVYYVEDTGAWPFDSERNAISGDSSNAVRFIARMMNWCGLSGRWAYRSAAQNGRVFGMTEAELSRLYRRAEAVVNLTGSTFLHDEQLEAPARVFLQTNLVAPEIETAQGHLFTVDFLSRHTHHFTYGENLGGPDCGVPTGQFRYRPTRQPVILHWWSNGGWPPNGYFTTIGNCRQIGKDIEWSGEVYTWSKHHEFLKFLKLPNRMAQAVELALSSIDQGDKSWLLGHGWRVRDGVAVSRDMFTYRDYIQCSSGEFTVAKDQNVRLRSGWFSDRSACYLAAGRPVITQDTGFGAVLPTGEGLFAFHTMDDILAAFDAVCSDYERHSRAAREIAAEHFRAETVLKRLLGEIGL